MVEKLGSATIFVFSNILLHYEGEQKPNVSYWLLMRVARQQWILVQSNRKQTVLFLNDEWSKSNRDIYVSSCNYARYWRLALYQITGSQHETKFVLVWT